MTLTGKQSRGHKERRGEPQPSDGFAEMQNPGVTHHIAGHIHERTRPFDGDDHGHDRHDTLPAEEEWVEEDLEPGTEHNPRK